MRFLSLRSAIACSTTELLRRRFFLSIVDTNIESTVSEYFSTLSPNLLIMPLSPLTGRFYRGPKSNDQVTNSVYDKLSSRLAALRRSLSSSPPLPVARPTAPSSTSGSGIDASLAPVVVQEALGPSPISQSFTPVADEQTRPTR